MERGVAAAGEGFSSPRFWSIVHQGGAVLMKCRSMVRETGGWLRCGPGVGRAGRQVVGLNRARLAERVTRRSTDLRSVRVHLPGSAFLVRFAEAAPIFAQRF